MVQFAPERKPHWGASLGSLLGSGLSGLANSKLQNIQKFNDENLGQQYGLNPEQARALSKADPAVRNDFFKQHEFVNRPSQGQQQPLEQLLQSLSQGQQQPQQMQGQAQQPEQNQLQQALQALSQQQSGQMQQQPQGQQPFGPVRKANPTDEYHKAVIDLKKQGLDIKKQEDIRRRYDPIIKEHAQAYQTNSTMIPLLDTYLSRVKDAREKGQLPSPLEESLLTSFAEKGIGGVKFDLRSLRGAPAEELRKLSAQLVNVASAGIPGVKTNLRVTNLMKAVPNLLQSAEGQEVIADQMKILAEAANVPFEVDQELIEQNGGDIPKDYLTRSQKEVVRRQKEILSRLSPEFDSSRETIQTPNGQITVSDLVDKLPEASSSKNERYYDPEKQIEVISNGKSWVKYSGQKF